VPVLFAARSCPRSLPPTILHSREGAQSPAASAPLKQSDHGNLLLLKVSSIRKQADAIKLLLQEKKKNQMLHSSVA